MPGPRPTDLRGLLRHEAARRDRLPERLRRTSRPRANIRRQRWCGGSSRTSDRLVQFMRDFNERQSQLFFVIALVPGPLQAARAAAAHRRRRRAKRLAALAATFETAARGVIYEHRPASLPAERLATALKALLTEAGRRTAARHSTATRRGAADGSNRAAARRPFSISSVAIDPVRLRAVGGAGAEPVDRPGSHLY